jgi:hypothetical protein
MHVTEKHLEVFMSILKDLKNPLYGKHTTPVWIGALCSTSSDLVLNSRSHFMLTRTVIITAQRVLEALRVLDNRHIMQASLELLIMGIKATDIPDEVDIYAVVVFDWVG